ncbi:DUF2867 domain-containing protein [Sunxiuqinia indica]|uniref:DUF2867 domain-containing protein n=1 Tax=Sunxiuqinia indica TaxID=2692584 RepID=UPI0013583CAA|nr:DUF2867 domain-containing protein [Sunxiuqinia indica]
MAPKNKVDSLSETHINSIISKNFGRTDYSDTYRVVYNGVSNVDALLSKIFSVPRWVNNLLKFRDKLVGSFGLKTGKESLTLDYYPVGSKAVFFKVIARNENEIVMAEDDKHLNFRTSVLVECSGNNTTVYQSTIVRYNNIWGRLYFLLVKPIHRIIMKLLLRNVN